LWIHCGVVWNSAYDSFFNTESKPKKRNFCLFRKRWTFSRVDANKETHVALVAGIDIVPSTLNNVARHRKLTRSVTHSVAGFVARGIA
jgi:hypothetical protein